MFNFFLSFGTLRLWKHCFLNKYIGKDDDPNQDLIGQLVMLVEEDVISVLEDQSCLSDASSLDWYDVSSEVQVKSNLENQDSSSVSANVEPEVSLPLSLEVSSHQSVSPNLHDNLEVDQFTRDKREIVQEKDDVDQANSHDCSLIASQKNKPVETIETEPSANCQTTIKSSMCSKEISSVSPASKLQNNSLEKVKTNQNNQRSTCLNPKNNKRLANRLDVSKMAVRAALIVIVEERGWKQDGVRSKRIFISIYETLGKNGDLIEEIAIGENCIKIYTENEKNRLIIMRELKEMNQFVRETSPYQLYVQNPLKPSIQFLCCADTYKLPSCDLLAIIRNENNWESEWTVNIESKEWIRKLRKAKLSLIIDSRIRDKIEMEDGIISVAGKETKVFDKFGISQCSVCLRFGHSKCRSQIRCFFCSGFHSDRYPHDKFIEQKYCFLCRIGGHAPISKNCPTLIKEIRSKLELIDHKYKEIFVGTDRSY